MKPLSIAIATFIIAVTAAIVYAENRFRFDDSAAISEDAQDAPANKNAPSPTADAVAPQNVADTGGSHLDLSASGLTKIPDNVFNVTGITVLNVSHNRLVGAIQSEIGKLKNLRVLDASHNQMTGVPAEIGHLPELEVLDLSYNKITGLPHELGELKKLKLLNISGNKYSSQDLNYIKSKLPAGVEIVVK